MTSNNDYDGALAPDYSPALLLALLANDDFLGLARGLKCQGWWEAKVRRGAETIAHVAHTPGEAVALAADALGIRSHDGIHALEDYARRTAPEDCARGLVGALRLRAIDERDDDGALSRELVDAGEAVRRADYFGAVRGAAEDILRGIEAGTITDTDGLETHAEQSATGSEWTIADVRAAYAVRLSDNGTALEDDLGSVDADVNERAAYAMRLDILADVAELGRERFGEDFDPQDDSTWPSIIAQGSAGTDSEDCAR